ncbi:M24 family metallopeptidase [Fimbriimonas ginsengisoli]|uniref:Xaa-Pro dipeptidase n=1 Tax=Fimbriimonas ginsengisoli Gsoil 348 TaxID=661478 RepID=A0A068NQ95_FIMGI|nr:Xaa-Pro peptidase family protein [Fimbriimonas ginsengisoli]AIE85532.1 Xaa-Pro dipeptidase [Fimbriimonas ginsengisoli Gsoil 348]
MDKLRAELAREGVEAMLVSDPTNVGWLTGFTGTFGRTIVTPKDALFVTDSRYTIQAQEEVKGMSMVSFANPIDGDEFTAQQARSLGITRLGFETATTTYSQWQRLTDKFDGIELVPVRDVLSEMRQVKGQDEVDKIRRACGVSDAAFDHVRRLIQPGVTELDIALDLEFFMRRQGAEVAFPSIVVSGERSARPHGKPSEKKLEIGDFVTMDFGARVEGYNSDITRTVVVGEATDRHREVYGAVLEAQLKSLDAIKPGAKARDIDRLSRDVLATHGLDKYFGHGLGHGLGRIVHDTGRLSPSSEDTIRVGQVWTVEPGVYIPGFGGVRIEDDVLVTETGIEIFNHSTKELLVLPEK